MKLAPIALAVLALAALSGCAPITLNYAPGVVDDALAGALTYGHLAPDGDYRLGGGPGNTPRGCHSTSNGHGRDAVAAAGTTFLCEQDFDAQSSADYIAAGYAVAVTQKHCWRARRTYLRFVRIDGRGPKPDLLEIPARITGCRLPSA
jgi:hypothetical protein